MPEETSLLSESPDSDDDIDDAQGEGEAPKTGAPRCRRTCATTLLLSPSKT